MDRLFHSIWGILTNNNMYSTTETILSVVVSVILTVAFLRWNAKEAARKHKILLILDLGYEGYLRHKEAVGHFGIHVD